MTRRVVLDAGGLDALDAPTGGAARAVVEEAVVRGAELGCTAVTVAELSRGRACQPDRESAWAGDRFGCHPRAGHRPPFARLVATVLHAASAGSEDMADAHVVACCIGADQALVLTTDPEDLRRLSEPLVGLRVLIRLV